MNYISKAQRQLDGDLLLRPDAQALLYRTVHDMFLRLAAQQDDANDDCMRALARLQEVLGPYAGDHLPSVKEMLGDPQRDRLARNLLKG